MNIVKIKTVLLPYYERFIDLAVFQLSFFYLREDSLIQSGWNHSFRRSLSSSEQAGLPTFLINLGWNLSIRACCGDESAPKKAQRLIFYKVNAWEERKSTFNRL